MRARSPSGRKSAERGLIAAESFSAAQAPSNTLLRFVQLILLACLLSSCDGGLFGTGDGQIIVENVDADAGIGDDVVATPNAEETDGTTESFENLQVGTTTTAPLINVINVSDQAILARSVTNDNALFAGRIPADTFSQTAELQLGQNNLVLIDPDTTEELLSIRPLNVGASTLTTLIVRNTATQDLNVVFLSSMSLSLSPTVAQVRIVQANLLSNEDTVSSFSLLPSGSEPGSAEVDFLDVSVATASAANYQSIGPGDYVLADSLGRIEMESLSLQAGKIYTLIILGNSGAALDTDQDTAILLHEDSLLAR